MKFNMKKILIIIGIPSLFIFSACGNGRLAAIRLAHRERLLAGRQQDFIADKIPVSYTHLTLPTNREV